MNEVFTDVYGTIFTVNDEGITIKYVSRVVFFHTEVLRIN